MLPSDFHKSLFSSHVNTTDLMKLLMSSILVTTGSGLYSNVLLETSMVSLLKVSLATPCFGARTLLVRQLTVILLLLQYMDKMHSYWMNMSTEYNQFVALYLITSTKEVMFSPGFVCGFVSLFGNKITQKLMDGF